MRQAAAERTVSARLSTQLREQEQAHAAARGAHARQLSQLRGEAEAQRAAAVSDLPCSIRREGGKLLVIGGSPSLVLLEGKGV